MDCNGVVDKVQVVAAVVMGVACGCFTSTTSTSPLLLLVLLLACSVGDITNPGARSVGAFAAKLAGPTAKT